MEPRGCARVLVSISRLLSSSHEWSSVGSAGAGTDSCSWRRGACRDGPFQDLFHHRGQHLLGCGLRKPSEEEKLQARAGVAQLKPTGLCPFLPGEGSSTLPGKSSPDCRIPAAPPVLAADVPRQADVRLCDQSFVGLLGPVKARAGD